LGWGKASSASHRGGRAPGTERELGLTKRPLTRENSTPRSPNCPAHAGMGGGKSADRPGDQTEGASRRSDTTAGIAGPLVVLADRFDGRSRRTTRGQARPGVKSAEEGDGLAPHPSKRGARGSEGASEAGSGWQNPAHRWRVRVRGSTRKRGVERAFVDGRRPGALDPRSLTGPGG